MQLSSNSDKKLTPIQKFYDGQSILITGGTGFLGKLLIEKLLRSCPTIMCIYILIRPKKGKDVLQRKNELFKKYTTFSMLTFQVFSKLREDQSKFQDKIICITGDCNLPNLGITTLDRNTLINKISIIFHVAATIRFNENIKLATKLNVQSLKSMISLSKEMPKLISFVHISTLYSQCIYNPVEETFYEAPMDEDKLINLVDNLNEELLNYITPKLLGSWPNTYVYTKSIAENIIRKQAGLLPIGIFRPAIVVSTYREPVPGWVDNFNGPMGIFASAASGLLRTHNCDGSVKPSIVPVDLTANALIVSAWDIANNRRSKQDIPIYNYTSDDNPITYKELIDKTLNYTSLTPFKNAIWYCNFSITKYRLLHLFYVYFLHLLPAFIIDTVLLCSFKKPWLLKIYGKLNEMVHLLSYFSLKEWKYPNERWKEAFNKLKNEDRELFYCDMKDVVWDTFFRTYLLGIRIYLLNDPIETIPQARKKWKRYLSFFFYLLSIKAICVTGIYKQNSSLPQITKSRQCSRL
ncbi:PREDICTED: putative fatty acyl-CoA reductase CG5065 [Polistes dominula]|uniref:Fatty acyl-CoA reductase n=1 Tax=Polistes dominula TaxID=743375 RepID=A0ABM1HXF0_POLDO|nr:PREDICTED: putative fatty acyl-CoA reductase CG5065 [Polistes dominula]